MGVNPPKRILIIDDEPQLLAFLKNLFESGGWEALVASSGAEGIEKIERERFDVILTDLVLPGEDGIEVLRTVKKIRSDAEVVLMTGYGTVDSAIEAMRSGAFHFLTKPFRAEEVCNLVDKAYDRGRLARENRVLKAEARGRYRIEDIVGTSAAIQEVASRVQRLGDSETPILIEGEHGSGRGFFARMIHYQSARSGGPFVPVDCAGLSEELLESELFGYAQGAYQRAMLPRAGKAELARRGTLYLADIDRAGMRIQEKVLRLLEAKTVTPAGSDREIEIDVRLVASSASRTDQQPETGSFLPALRDALQPGLIRLPALRERPEDIPLLLHHFLFEANRHRKKPIRGVSDAAMAALTAYPWPGNVRELADRAKSISSRKKQGSVVDAADLPTEILYGQRPKTAPPGSSPPKAAPGVREVIQDLDRQMARQALALSDGDRERAAALLKIELAVLEELLREDDTNDEDGGRRP